VSLPQPASEPLPLTTWQQIWRNLFAVGLGALLFAEVSARVWERSPALFWLDLGLGVASMVLLQWRRRFPVAVAVTIGAVGVLSTSAAGASVVALVSLSTHRRWRQIIPVSVLSLLTGLAYIEVQPADDAPWWLMVAFNVVSIGVMVSTGLYIGARRELLATLQDRAERAESEQAMRVEQARANERTRIAREMHDVLAHRMSLVAMHAGALAYRSDLGPKETRRTAGVIQSNAHAALTDLREVLGLLRGPGAQDGEIVPERPQPTLRDIPDLVQEARVAGMNVTLTDDVRDPELAPENIGRSAYRMIQESLTNASKHAAHTPVQVLLRGEAGGRLSLEVRNPMRIGDSRTALPNSGLGLIGLAERAALAGGRLEQETTSDQHFVVRAWLPWPA
jgi:signal transduction histidine kinase